MQFHALTNALELIRLLREPLATLARKDPKLADEAKRAARSIAFNTSEGRGRLKRDRVHFFSIAQGSACELETELAVAISEGLLAEEALRPALACLDREKRLLWGLTPPRK